MSVALKKRARSTGRGKHERPARLSRFAQRLLAEWKRLELPAEGAQIVLAVSGGADSVALLLALDELLKADRLYLSLVVAHLDHGLRASSQEDAAWVEELARRTGYEFEHERCARLKAGGEPDNLEQAARRARYGFLARVCEAHNALALLTAHTMDDQAETVLLRLLRGSGAEGLGGMEPVRPLSESSDLLLVRPLLNWARRAETVQYCVSRGVEFRRDEMNEDESFARVRVRKRLLPLMQGFNARVVEGIARTSQLLREDARALNELAATLLERALEEPSDSKDLRGGLSVTVLKAAPAGLRRRALRLWLAERRGSLRRLEMVHLLAVEQLLSGERGGRRAELPGGAQVERRRGRLLFRPKRVENEGVRD